MQSYVRAAVWLSCFWFFQLTGAVAQDVQLEQLLSKEEQSRLGIAAMSPDKKAAMRDALVKLYQQGYRAGLSATKPVAVPAASVVETQVDGEFTRADHANEAQARRDFLGLL
jgi:hypothetical protein